MFVQVNKECKIYSKFMSHAYDCDCDSHSSSSTGWVPWISLSFSIKISIFPWCLHPFLAIFCAFWRWKHNFNIEHWWGWFLICQGLLNMNSAGILSPRLWLMNHMIKLLTSISNYGNLCYFIWFKTVFLYGIYQNY